MSQRLTLVLLGGSAVGKSSSGNTIMGRTAFESRPSVRPVTTRVCEHTEQVLGQQVSVVDTPGILNHNTQLLIQLLCEEHLHRPSSVFLVVLKVGRISSEQIKALERTVELLGPKGLRRSLLLFTYGAALKGTSLEDLIFEDNESSLPDTFNNMFERRHHVFDNEAWGPRQVHTLLQKIQCFYTGTSPPGIGLEDVDLHRELRLVLLGLPGAGKSSSGNTILGPKTFRANCGFNPVTTDTECKTATVQGRRVTVVDTPSFSDEAMKPKKLFRRIMKSVLHLTSGPHAFIIVVRLGRVNRRDTKLLQLMPKLFDENASEFTMVLFTHGDDLRGENIRELINANETMKTLVQKCDQRCCIFNNNSSDRQQVRELFNTIDNMVQASGEDQCNSQIFKLTTGEEIGRFFQKLWRMLGDFSRNITRTNDASDVEMPLLC